MCLQTSLSLVFLSYLMHSNKYTESKIEETLSIVLSIYLLLMKLKITIQDWFLILTTFSALHFVALPYLCSNVAYSIYFKKGKQVEEKVEYDFYEDIEHKIYNKHLAIVVQTSNSRDTSYRNRTLGSIFTEMMRTEGHQVIVCSADGTEKSLNMPMMSHFKLLLPCLIKTKDCTNASEEKDREKKIVKDFVLCHEAVENEINLDIKYLLWLEDDVILMKDFFYTLSSILTFRKMTLQSQKWLDIKLYLNPRLRGNHL